MVSQRGKIKKKTFCRYKFIDKLVAGQIEKTYSCCSGKANTVGCAVSPCHVNDGDETQLLSGYVKTQPLKRPLGSDESYGIYALDCEMVKNKFRILF